MARMIGTKGLFRFFPVGQGMFYGGNILSPHGSVHFVYDCGALFGESHLNRVIEDGDCFFQSKLDMLFISHFDLDHVNGIPKLLRTMRQHSGLIVVLPYFTLEELRVFQIKAAYYLSEHKRDLNEIDELRRFTFNPYLYFLQNKLVERVYVIANNGEGTEEEKEPLKNYKFEFLFSNVNPQKELFYDLELKERHRGFSDKLKVVEKSLVVKFADVWYWKAVVPPTTQKSMKAFMKELKSTGLLDKNNRLSMESFISSCKDNTAIKKAYKMIAKDINFTSLIVAHAPIDKTDSLIRKGFATVLFGDATLTSKQSNMCSYFMTMLGKELQNAIFLSVPHHGSCYNWNKKFMNLPKQRAFWIVSAKTKNIYRHPHNSVIYDFLHCQATCESDLYWCNENTDVDMVICINKHCGDLGGWNIFVKDNPVAGVDGGRCKSRWSCCSLVSGL